MAQLSGAQREPSMEEILASIRRIIEDSDTGHVPVAVSEAVRPDNDVPAMSEDAAPNAWPPETKPVATVIEVDAFRAELRASLPVEAKKPAVEARKPISLAEVQAQVAADQVAARAAAEQAYRDVAVSAPAATAEQDMAAAAAAQDAVASRSAGTREWNLEAPTTEPIVSSEAGKRRDETMNAVLDDISARQARRAPVDESRHEPDIAAEPASMRQSLISDQAGKQVAAAFGELSEAFAARSKKSVDDMAEEMLRPMLQDWLDNNLPLLVERLVREEIERVARGS